MATIDPARLGPETRRLVERGVGEAFGISLAEFLDDAQIGGVDLTAEDIEGLRSAGELAERIDAAHSDGVPDAETIRGRQPEQSSSRLSPAAGGSPPVDEDDSWFTDETEEGVAEIVTGAPHPRRLPKSPSRTPEEQQLIDDLTRIGGGRVRSVPASAHAPRLADRLSDRGRASRACGRCREALG